MRMKIHFQIFQHRQKPTKSTICSDILNSRENSKQYCFLGVCITMPETIISISKQGWQVVIMTKCNYIYLTTELRFPCSWLIFCICKSTDDISNDEGVLLQKVYFGTYFWAGQFPPVIFLVSSQHHYKRYLYWWELAEMNVPFPF